MSRTFLPNLNISAFWLVGSSRNTHHRNAESSLRRPRPGSWLFFSFRETTWMPSDEAAVWEYGTADRLAAAASGVAKKLRKINPAERRQERRNVLKVSAARAAESGSEDISRKWAILNGHGNRPGYSIYAQRTSTTETQGSCGAVGAQEGNFQYSPLARTKILIERVHPCLLTRFAPPPGRIPRTEETGAVMPWRLAFFAFGRYR